MTKKGTGFGFQVKEYSINRFDTANKKAANNPTHFEKILAPR